MLADAYFSRLSDVDAAAADAAAYFAALRCRRFDAADVSSSA